MPIIAKYTRLVDDLEQGRFPPELDTNAAIDKLIVEIIVFPWKTGAQQMKAQSLAARLSKVKKTPKE
jgi:hypothetical protein